MLLQISTEMGRSVLEPMQVDAQCIFCPVLPFLYLFVCLIVSLGWTYASCMFEGLGGFGTCLATLVVFLNLVVKATHAACCQCPMCWPWALVT